MTRSHAETYTGGDGVEAWARGRRRELVGEKVGRLHGRL